MSQNQFGISVSPVVSVDNGQWSIAGNINGENPNILSEVIFENSFSIGSDVEFAFKANKYLELSVSYADLRTLSGQGTDTDYDSDNRSDPTFELPFENRNGYINRIVAALKYDLLVAKQKIVTIGFKTFIYRQKFGISSRDNANLNSFYLYRSRGIGLSLERKISLVKKASIQPGISLYLSSFNSYGRWNLRTSLNPDKSFIHRSKGIAFNLWLRSTYRVTSKHSLHLTCGNRFEKTYVGSDYLLYSNGGITHTQFNGSLLRSAYIKLGFSYWI